MMREREKKKRRIKKQKVTFAEYLSHFSLSLLHFRSYVNSGFRCPARFRLFDNVAIQLSNLLWAGKLLFAASS